MDLLSFRFKTKKQDKNNNPGRQSFYNKVLPVFFMIMKNDFPLSYLKLPIFNIDPVYSALFYSRNRVDLKKVIQHSAKKISQYIKNISGK